MTVRLLHFLVQPVVVVDDGDNLNPGPPVQPSTLSLDGLRDLLDRWPEHLASIAAQVEPPAPEQAEPTDG